MIERFVFLMSSRVISQRESFRGRLEVVAFCGDFARPPLIKTSLRSLSSTTEQGKGRSTGTT